MGPKTSATTLLFSNLRIAALPVDSHYHRVAQRLGLIGQGRRKSRPLLPVLLPPDWTAQQVYDHHGALMYHGQKCCFYQTPACGRCVVLDVCPFGQARLSVPSAEERQVPTAAPAEKRLKLQRAGYFRPCPTMFTAFRNLRYLVAYTVPLTAFAGLWLRGPFVWITLAYTFGLVPLMELLWRPQAPSTLAPAATDDRRHWFFDGLLYLNVPLQLGLLATFLWRLHTGHFSPSETLGATLAVGICGGALGINVAHELGHRSKVWEQRLAQILLWSVGYLHFFIEHNRGHHRHVATPLDPVTARLHEPFWHFLPRAVGGELRSAWQLEAERLRRAGQPVWEAGNQMLQFGVAQLTLLGLIAGFFGPTGLLAWAGAALVSLLLFQLVNYVEHYGLLRNRTATGGYERVQPHHSWNSEHALGRILLYELTRHSDHHYQASRPYQTLRHQPVSPQMPTGYPGMMLLATVPPLWFRVMNRRVPVA